MNREILSRAKFCINETQRIGQAQSWLLAPPMARGAAAVNNLQAVAQRSVVLQSITMDSSVIGGTIAAAGLRVAGLSLNCGNNPIPIAAFATNSGGTSAATRNIGVALSQQQTVEVTANLSAAGDFGYSIGVQPIPTHMVPDTEAQSDYFNFVVGCGTTGVIAPGAAGNTTTTVLRGCWLSEVVCTDEIGAAGAPLTDIVLTDLTINGLSMLCGTAAQQIPLTMLVPQQSNTTDFILDVWVEANSTITFNFSNLNAAALNANIGAAIFCKPYKRPLTGGHAAAVAPSGRPKIATVKRG